MEGGPILAQEVSWVSSWGPRGWDGLLHYGFPARPAFLG